MTINFDFQSLMKGDCVAIHTDHPSVPYIEAEVQLALQDKLVFRDLQDSKGGYSIDYKNITSILVMNGDI